MNTTIVPPQPPQYYRIEKEPDAPLTPEEKEIAKKERRMNSVKFVIVEKRQFEDFKKDSEKTIQEKFCISHFVTGRVGHTNDGDIGMLHTVCNIPYVGDNFQHLTLIQFVSDIGHKDRCNLSTGQSADTSSDQFEMF